MALIEKQPDASDGLQIPGLVQNQETVEQLSFAADPLTPVPWPMPTQQDNTREQSGIAMTPYPVSQSGAADMPMTQPEAAYSSGLGSSSGLADIDTAHQPIARAKEATTQAFGPISTSYPGGSSSLPGLADIDTAHQPISQPERADAGNPPSPAPASYTGGPSSTPGLRTTSDMPQGGPSSTPGLDANSGVPQSFAQGGAGSTSALDNSGGVSRPLSQVGLEKFSFPQGLASPGATRVLRFDSQPGVTRTLEETRAEANTTASRPPVVIRGTNQPNRARSMRPPQGRRHVISIAGVLLLLVMTMGMLIVASPLGQDVRATFSGQPAIGNLIQNTPNNMSLIAQATATAVVHQQNDGYDPTSNGGGPVLTGSSGSWPYGVCTYWANLRYHELTGHWVTWTGNAYQWADGARLAGWHVSTSPHVPSIIVLMPGVEGASGYGHVAVVESASGNSAYTSNMNWYTNGGGYGIVSHYTFTAGSGVYFIWA